MYLWKAVATLRVPMTQDADWHMANGRDGLISQYISELQDLTFNSKPVINTLTMIASENMSAASGIAEAIERRIRTSAPAHKLPALYLLDSIVKNIGLPYTALFARELPQLYMAVWLSSPETRPALTKLFNTWHRFFPADILSLISQQSANPQASFVAAHSSQPYNAVPQLLRQPDSQGLGPQYFQQNPASSLAGAWPQSQPQSAAYNQHNQQYQQAPQAVVNGQLAQSQPVSNRYAAAYTPTYPQPQYSHQSPLTALAESPGGREAQLGLTAPIHPQAQGQPEMPDMLSQLISAGLLPAGRTGLSFGGAAKAEQKPQPVVPPLTFNLAKAKEWAPTALKQLMEGTKTTMPKFLDQRLHKKRKLASGAKSSRMWFAKSSNWLAGTTADAQAAPAFFDEPEKQEEDAAEEQASMPADPNQPTCALSGERFDTFWDDASNSWRYSDATALDAAQAEKYGLSEGTLVKVSCLGPAQGSQVGGAADTLEAAAGQRTAEEVAEAASAETLHAQPKAGRDKTAAEEIDGAERVSPKRQKIS